MFHIVSYGCVNITFYQFLLSYSHSHDNQVICKIPKFVIKSKDFEVIH